MPSIFDVAIIGAGPAGSATAIALARSGYAVVLIDKQIFPEKSSAVISSTRSIGRSFAI